MTDSAYLFNPENASFEARVRAFKEVLVQLRNTENSRKVLHVEAWSDRLGSKEEVEAAYQISKHSFELAAKSLSSEELSKAQSDGLLSHDDIQEVTIFKRQQAIKSNRKRTDSKSYKLSR